MFSYVFEKITDSMVKNGAVKSEEKEIYSYGVQQGLFILLNTGTAVIVGLLLGVLWQISIFMIALVTLKSYTGGYHTEIPKTCYILSTLITIIVSLTIKYLFLHTFIYVGLMVLSGIVIILFSPVGSENKPLDDLEKKVYGKRAVIICLIQISVAILLLCLNLKSIAVCIIWNLVAVSVMIVVAKLIACSKVKMKIKNQL